MASGQGDNHGKKKSWRSILFFVIVIILSIVLAFLLPDILYWVRTKVHPDSMGGITAKEYVEMVLIIIEICSTCILSFIAYHLAKTLGKITINDRKAKITLWATRIEREIKSNSVIILNKHIGLGANLDELYVLESSLADIINLNAEQKITIDEKKLLTSCENTILKIKKKCQKGEEPTEELKEYVQKFLDTSDTPELKFESKMETLMESLKKFSRGEE